MRAFTDEWRMVQRFRIKYVTGLVNLVVLASLKNKKMSGYDIMGLVHETFDLLLSPGTLYPVLKSMEKEGLIMGITDGRKRLYELTERGNCYTNLYLKSTEGSSLRLPFYATIAIVTDDAGNVKESLRLDLASSI